MEFHFRYDRMSCYLKRAIITTLEQREWVVLEKLIDILKIFKDLIGECSSEKSVTISKLLVLVFVLFQHVNNCDNSDLEDELKLVITTFRDTFLQNFQP